MCFPRVPFGGSTTTRLAFFLLIFQSNLPTLALGAKQRRQRRPFFLDDPDLEKALVESQTRTTKVFVSSSLQNKKAKRVERDDEYQGSLLCTPLLSFFVLLSLPPLSAFTTGLDWQAFIANFTHVECTHKLFRIPFLSYLIALEMLILHDLHLNHNGFDKSTDE